jgi:2-keto-3-deoxy-L-rhamnonate aldolase RhmA
MFDPARPALKAALETRKPLGFFWFSLGSVAVIEAAVAAGAEAVVVDMQHGLFDRGTLEAAIGVVPPHVPCLVRVEDDSATAIGRALDAGAEAVLVPLVESGEQAARAVEAAHYPPKGRRSGGGVRPLRDFGAYFAAAADAVTVGVMVETTDGVANARQIAAAAGVDFVFIGTGDLALSLGVPPGAPAHEQACRTVLEACRDAGRPCGIFTMNARAAAERIADGYAAVVVANDISAVGTAFSDALAAFRTTPMA